METLFENHSVRDKEWAKDFYGYLYLKRPLIVVFHIVLLLYFVHCLYYLIAYGYGYGAMFIPLVFFALNIWRYFTSIKLALKRDLECHGKPVEIQITVTENEIRYQASTKGEAVLHYSDVKQTVQTSKYIYVWTKANLVYSLKKDTFTVGSKDGFLAFLKQKGIRVK